MRCAAPRGTWYCVNMNMIEASDIETMSVTEPLQVIDQIWDSLDRDNDQISSPAWHQEVLAERKARAERGEAKFLTLAQLRSRLRSSEP